MMDSLDKLATILKKRSFEEVYAVGGTIVSIDEWNKFLKESGWTEREWVNEYRKRY